MLSRGGGVTTPTDLVMASSNNVLSLVTDKTNQNDFGRLASISPQQEADHIYMRNLINMYDAMVKDMENTADRSADLFRREAPEAYAIYIQSKQELDRRLIQFIIEKKCNNNPHIYASASMKEQRMWIVEVFPDFVNDDRNKLLMAGILETEDKISMGKFTELMEHFGLENIQKIISYKHKYGIETEGNSLSDQSLDLSRIRTKGGGGGGVMTFASFAAFAAEGLITVLVSEYEDYKRKKEKKEDLHRINQSLLLVYIVIRNRRYMTPEGVPKLEEPYDSVYHQTSKLLKEIGKLDTSERIADSDLSAMAYNLLSTIKSLNMEEDKSVLYYIAKHPEEVRSNAVQIKEDLIKIRNAIIHPYYADLAKALTRFKDILNNPHKALEAKITTDPVADTFKAALTIVFNDAERLIQKINTDRRISEQDKKALLERLATLHAAMRRFADIFRDQDREIINEVFFQMIRDIQVGKIYGSDDSEDKNFDLFKFLQIREKPHDNMPLAREVVKLRPENIPPNDIDKTPDIIRTHWQIARNAQGVVAALYKLRAFCFTPTNDQKNKSIIDGCQSLSKDIDEMLKTYASQGNVFSKENLRNLEQKLYDFSQKIVTFLANVNQDQQRNNQDRKKNNLFAGDLTSLIQLSNKIQRYGSAFSEENLTQIARDLQDFKQQAEQIIKNIEENWKDINFDIVELSLEDLCDDIEEHSENLTKTSFTKLSWQLKDFDQKANLAIDSVIVDRPYPEDERRMKSQFTATLEEIGKNRDAILEHLRQVNPPPPVPSQENQPIIPPAPQPQSQLRSKPPLVPPDKYQRTVNYGNDGQDKKEQAMPTAFQNQNQQVKGNDDELVPFFGRKEDGSYGGYINRRDIRPGMQWIRFKRQGKLVYGVGPELQRTDWYNTNTISNNLPTYSNLLPRSAGFYANQQNQLTNNNGYESKANGLGQAMPTTTSNVDGGLARQTSRSSVAFVPGSKYGSNNSR